MDPATSDFFRRQREDVDNQSCIDSGAANPQWASVSHGCYLSLESSGVHRSLGVHVSFVRSITMDSWKPIQLKLMELGGNKRLKAFFRKHGIADDMPTVQKYNTRAAEWYRKNLRAEAEGVEPPPPLPEGTGSLPAVGMTTNWQISSPHRNVGTTSVNSTDSAGNSQHAGGYHSGGGYHDGISPNVGAVSSGCNSMESVTQQGPARDGDDFFTGVFGHEVGTKVSGGFWSAFGATKKIAGRAKEMAEEKVTQAKNEGWIDAITDTTKQGVSVAMETTKLAAQKGVEVGKATYSHVNEKGGKELLNQTADVLGKTAKSSMTVAGSGIDWLGERIRPIGNEAALQNMSTGRMQGFGSDCPDPAASHETSPALQSYHEAGSEPLGPTHREDMAKKKADIWNDDVWDD